MTPPLVVFAEFGCTQDGEVELRKHLDQTLRETRATEGCLQATLWERPAERRFLFVTMWTDSAAVTRWVENDFHRKTLMPGFRKWCVEGSFTDLTVTGDHDRARKCAACGRWTAGRPGWSEAGPTNCRQCGAPLASARISP
jgi:quinol monooxygenase YgiN